MWIIDWIIKNANQVYNVLSVWYGKIRLFAEDAWGAFYLLFLERWPTRWGSWVNRIDRAIRFFRDTIDSLTDAYDAIWRSREEWFYFLTRGLQDLTAWWYDRIRFLTTQAFYALQEFYERLLNGVRYLVYTALGFLRWLHDTARAFVEWLYNSAKAGLEWLIGTALNWLKWLFYNARSGIEWLIHVALGWFQWLFNAARSGIEWLIQTALGWLQWLFHTARSGIEWLIHVALGWLRWLFNAARSGIEWLINTALGFLQWLFQTAKAPIEFLVSSFNKLVFVFSTAWDFLNSFLTNPVAVVFELIFSVIIDLILAFIYYVFLPTERR